MCLNLWKWIRQNIFIILSALGAVATILTFVITVLGPKLKLEDNTEQTIQSLNTKRSFNKEETPNTQEMITILSEPDGANVYLNWEYIGITPLDIKKGESNGIVVVTKSGYTAAVEETGHSQSNKIRLSLRPEIKATFNKALLIIARDEPYKKGFSIFRSQLLEENIQVLDWSDSEMFQKELKRSGGLSNEAIRSWANVRFGADTAIVSSITLNTNDLGDQKYGYEGIQDSLSDVYLSEAKIITEIINLRSGETEVSFTTTASSYDNNESISITNAITKAAMKAAKIAKQKITNLTEMEVNN